VGKPTWRFGTEWSMSERRLREETYIKGKMMMQRREKMP
jgi:hypothetical protein